MCVVVSWNVYTMYRSAKEKKKKKKEKKGGMSAVETDENEIHFNLSLLTKILQQYVGGGKLLPLRPTQTILVSCVRFILQKKKKT